MPVIILLVIGVLESIQRVSDDSKFFMFATWTIWLTGHFFTLLWEFGLFGTSIVPQEGFLREGRKIEYFTG